MLLIYKSQTWEIYKNKQSWSMRIKNVSKKKTNKWENSGEKQKVDEKKK